VSRRAIGSVVLPLFRPCFSVACGLFSPCFSLFLAFFRAADGQRRGRGRANSLESEPDPWGARRVERVTIPLCARATRRRRSGIRVGIRTARQHLSDEGAPAPAGHYSAVPVCGRGKGVPGDRRDAGWGRRRSGRGSRTGCRIERSSGRQRECKFALSAGSGH
jgi:hypothetical protein